jgi:hypothetical protein
VSGALSDAGGRASGTAIAPVAAWFARTRVFWRFLIVGVAVAVILTSSPLSGSLILWTAVVAVAALVVVEFLAAAGASGAPVDAPAPENEPTPAAADSSPS